MIKEQYYIITAPMVKLEIKLSSHEINQILIVLEHDQQDGRKYGLKSENVL